MGILNGGWRGAEVKVGKCVFLQGENKKEGEEIMLTCINTTGSRPRQMSFPYDTVKHQPRPI